MKALFVHSHIFLYDKNNNVYSEGKLTYNVWKRYLKHFEEITVAGRYKQVTDVKGLDISSGNRVTHRKLPNINSIKSYNLNNKILSNLIKEVDIVIARLPSMHSNSAIRIAKKLRKPYIIELVGDTLSSYWYHGNILGKFLAPISYLKVRSTVKSSNNILYVTNKFLQQRYPSKLSANTVNCSNVELFIDEGVLERRINKITNSNREKIVIGLVGSYSSKYKGIDNAIKVVYNLKNQGYSIELKILGSGNNNWLLSLISNLDVEENVKFSGSLKAGKDVYKWMDNIDIYIQPSLTEGLPRALIEAMSRGCPSIGSRVGGIPELLDDEFLHLPKDETTLLKILLKLINNKELMVKQAMANYENAQQFSVKNLEEKRDAFLKSTIKNETF
ncbi:MAG: glycosyltransferase [Bacillaceae bacterium]|nr:glycosyltransferase [Bacillaceae bacterium]